MAIVTQATKGKLVGNIAKIISFGGQDRYLWNLVTAEGRERYDHEKKFTFYKELSARLPKLLKTDPKLVGFKHRCAQMAMLRYETALKKGVALAKDPAEKARRAEQNAKRAARGLPRKEWVGFPQFKSKDDNADGFSFKGKDCRFNGDRVRLPGIGWVRVRGLQLPESVITAFMARREAEKIADRAARKRAVAEARKDGDICGVSVTQEPNGWFLSVQFEGAAKEYRAPVKPVVGIDRGLSALVALGELTIAPPQFGRKAEQRIRRLNRQRDRRRKADHKNRIAASCHRRRTVRRLGRLHRATRNARHDFLHQLTRKLVDTYAGFAVEDLSLKGLMRTRLAKSFADAGLGEFLRMLSYKAEWAQREWRMLGRFQRSTGVCPDPACGWVGPRLRPGIETWVCQGCGTIYRRDPAASEVILRDATLVRASGVPPVRREPSGPFRRKPGAAVRGGIGAYAPVSHGGSPGMLL
jgi:putative transposase